MKNDRCSCLALGLACLLWLIAALPLAAQVEVNVKLRPSAEPLRQWLDRRPDRLIRAAEVPSALRSSYPYLSDWQEAGALLPRRNTPTAYDLDRVYTLLLPENQVQNLIAQMQNSGQFEYVELNHELQVYHAPADAQAYRPNDDSLASQWYLDYIRAPQAWDITRGDATLRIGVIDTGIDYDHPEFDGQLSVNPAEDRNGNGRFDPWPASELRNGVSGDLDGLDQDHNGYPDDVIGYDFVDQPRNPFGGDFFGPDPDPLDDNDHGTLVSGVIGAKADNQYGGAGLAHRCKLVTLRAFAASGGGQDDDVARAIIYAADNGIQLLNFSFGEVYDSRIMHDAIRYAYDLGVVMVASSGNGTGDNLHYPSGYNEVISVSASTANLNSGREFLWPLSSYGVTVDLCAPGANIFTTTVRDTAADGRVTAFTRTQGTSFAAPMVTSAAALLFSRWGPLTPEQVRGIVSTTADDLANPGWDHLTGGGRLNLERALTAVGASNVQILSPLNDGGSAADSVYLVGTVLDPEFVRFHLEYQRGTQDSSDWQPILMDQRNQRQRDTLGTWDLRGLPEGDYTLRLRLERSNGFTREDRIRFVRDTTPPEVEVRRAVPIWDNESRGWWLTFRSDDRARHELRYRRLGNPNWLTATYDRSTRNGEFFLGRSDLTPGEYQWQLVSTNPSGLRHETPLATFTYDGGYLAENGWEELPYGLPIGRFLDRPFDFDGDGLLEVVMSEYDNQLTFGSLKLYEFTGGFFRQVDSNAFRPILIPKDVADTDGDGLLELLASVNDSMYTFEQPNATGFPSEVLFRDEGNQRYAARFGDTDGDGQPELLAKDFEDYFVYQGQGANFQEVAQLEDVSPDYAGSIAPRVLVEDFDQDGRPEVAYGDFDGDLIVYEHRGGNNYVNTFIDSAELTKSGVYLTAGDFDGDGVQEIFVASHPSPLRNDDFENEGLFWWLRIFEATGNDQFEVVWEDYLYDLDLEETNAATAGNLDNDPADELVFTTYPRTYLLEQVNGVYQFTWFYFGSLASHHVIGDFNGNGINELGLGRIDSTKFFEKQIGRTGPVPVTQLRGFVLGANQIRIEWTPSPNATGYEIWRLRDPNHNDVAEVATVGALQSWTDTNLDSGVPYLYVLRALNPSLTPEASGFGNLTVLTPRQRPRLDSARAWSANQAILYFDQPVTDRLSDRPYVRLNGEHHPQSLIAQGDPGRRLLASFSQNLAPGNNRIELDSSFLDAGRAFMDPNFRQARFLYEAEEEECLHLTEWETVDDKNAVLFFNLPLDPSTALDSSRYRLDPLGSVGTVQFYQEFPDAVQVTIEEARFGALGYPLSVTVENLCALNGLCLCPEGNTATFSSHKDDLSEVFAYPNPVRPHQLFEGMRFANLTQQADIKVMTLSGRLVIELEETDGDGGLTWDMLDQGKRRIKPGVYIYYVETEEEGIEPFMGKFSVVE